MITVMRCPVCGYEADEPVPAEVCVIVYDCGGCGAEIRPKEGDCCVFCSYGADPCPTSPRRMREDDEGT